MKILAAVCSWSFRRKRDFTGSCAGNGQLAVLLYKVSSNDFVTLTGVGVLLTAVAFLAIYFPARRAMLVGPMEALRYE
jgi:ABC-type lipoprotein release transport system permease subunit